MRPTHTDVFPRLILGAVAVSLMVGSLFGAFFGIVIVGYGRGLLGDAIGAAFFLAALSVFALSALGAKENRAGLVGLAGAVSLALLLSHEVLTNAS